MPRCPKCTKRFKTETRVLQHMNQPLSSCTSWMPELTRIQDPTTPIPASRSDSLYQTLPVSSPGTPLADILLRGQSVTIEDDIVLDDNAMASDWMELTSGDIKDKYPGAADIYGRGQTFMDRFNADVYAQHR